MSTQVSRNCPELYDFDLEAEPVLEVLVARSLELAQLEIFEEQRADNLRKRKWDFEVRRRAKFLNLQKLFFHQQRLDFEKKERVRERELRQKVDAFAAEKLFCMQFTRECVVGRIFQKTRNRLKFKRMQPCPKILQVKQRVDQAILNKINSKLQHNHNVRNLLAKMANNAQTELKQVHLSTMSHDRWKREFEKREKSKLKERKRREAHRQKMELKRREKIKARRLLLEELQPMIENRHMLKKEDLLKTYCFGYWNLLDFKLTPGQYSGRKSKPMHSDLFGLAYDLMISITLLYQERLLLWKPGDEFEIISAGPFSTQFDNENLSSNQHLDVIESQQGIKAFSQDSLSNEGKNQIPKMRNAGHSKQNLEFSEQDITWDGTNHQNNPNNQLKTANVNKAKPKPTSTRKKPKTLKGSESEPGLINTQNTFTKKSQFNNSPSGSNLNNTNKPAPKDTTKRPQPQNETPTRVILKNCPAILETALSKWASKNTGLKFALLLSSEFAESLMTYEQMLWQHLIAAELGCSHSNSKNGRSKKGKLTMRFEKEKVVKELQTSTNYSHASTSKNSAYLVFTYYRHMTQKNAEFPSRKQAEMLNLNGHSGGREFFDFKRWLETESFLEGPEFRDLLLQFERLRLGKGGQVDIPKLKELNPLLGFFFEKGIFSRELYIEYLKVVIKTRLKFLKNHFKIQIRKATIRYKDSINNMILDEKSGLNFGD